MRAKLSLAALVGAVVMLPSAALAQGAIGSAIYSSGVRERLMAEERKCQAGVPASAKDFANCGLLISV